MNTIKNFLFLTFAALIINGCSNANVTLTDKELAATDPLLVDKKTEPTPSSAPTTEAQQNNSNAMAQSDVFVLIKTSVGDIKLKLYKETPLHQANFIKLVNDNYYNGVLFHRVIKGFMIQTGDPDSKKAEPGATYGMGGPEYKIPAEILPQFYHKKGALAAARSENPEKVSSGSQFYIVQGTIAKPEQLQGGNFSEQAIKDYTTIGGAPMLDGNYTVFGETISGLDIVDKIANTKIAAQDRPAKDIKIISAAIVEN